ncbi:MAG: ubiquitin-like domain-containing protein [Peptococcaceae bacterium]|nr:ubiquitin-like domain-containing protein [Peptococcaceae bacterium]
MTWKTLAVRRENQKNKRNGLRAPGKRGFLVLGVVAAVLVLVLFSGYAWAKKSVVLAVDGKETPVQTYSRTVDGLLKEQNVVLLEKDEVVPDVKAPLRNGMVVAVNRAVELTIAVDGRELTARTRGRTVEEVLEEYGVGLGPEDEVTPGRDAPVVPAMRVQVARVRTDTVVEEAAIEYKTQKRYTTRLPEGSTRVAQEGREGTERRIWQVVYRDGREVNRQLASREVISPPEDRVVMVGSGMVVSRGGENIRYSEVIEMLASGYTYTGANTASGVPPHYGVAAVDPGRIPMGTRLYVEGYGYATALDRGSAIVGNRIDLFFESRSEALGWGLRRVKVYILD